MRNISFSRGQLIDLEELVSQITRLEERELISEAVNCYYAGAYRAAIIVAWVAAADILFTRLREIAHSDGDAKKRLEIVEKQQNDGNSVEKELIRAFGSSQNCLGILDRFEERELEIVAEWRNNCAHSTGFRPTAEQARTAIRTVVDAVMLKPLERGYGYLNELYSSYIAIGKPYTHLMPDRRVVQVLVRDLRSNLRYNLFEKCLNLYSTNPASNVAEICLVFAEQCLLQMKDSSELNKSLQFMYAFLDSCSSEGLSLLCTLNNLNSVPNHIRSKSVTIVREFILGNVLLPEQEVNTCKKLIEKGLVSAKDLLGDDLRYLSQLLREKQFFTLENVARCFPDELTATLAESFALLRNQDISILFITNREFADRIMLSLDIYRSVGSRYLVGGIWYKDLANAIIGLADMEEDIEEFDGSDRTEPRVLTSVDMRSILKIQRGKAMLEMASQFPDDLLEYVLEEATDLFKIYPDSGRSISLLWIDVIDCWVKRRKDLPDVMKKLIHNQPDIFSGEKINSRLSLIQAKLLELGFHETTRLLQDVTARSLPF